MEDPESRLLMRIAALLGRDVDRLSKVSRGYTGALRYIVEMSGGETAFAKCATDERTSAWLTAEYRVYQELSVPHIPVFMGWDQDNDPILVLEDLSSCTWPPPWRPEQIDAVLLALDDIHNTSITVPEYAELFTHRGWHEVAEMPEPFLSMGLVTADWLAESLPVLIEARDRVTTTGVSLTHFDLRSDNVCFRDEKALLIDWSNACLGNADLDTAFWLPRLNAEGGPKPQEILPHRGDLAAYVTGYFASRAGLPAPGAGTIVRDLQRRQLEAGLRWVIDELDLPPVGKVV